MARKPKDSRKGGEYGKRGDYVRHGSPAHADILLIRAAEAEDGDLVIEDGEGRKWALMDETAFGHATDRHLLRILKQKVNELMTPPKRVQSADRNAPNYMEPMWDPEGVLV